MREELEPWVKIDGEPPWGRCQPKRLFAKIHSRWIKKLGLPKRTPDRQCGGCCFYIPLEGGLGGDWGVCTSSDSKHDRKAVFEHFSCPHWRY